MPPSNCGTTTIMNTWPRTIIGRRNSPKSPFPHYIFNIVLKVFSLHIITLGNTWIITLVIIYFWFKYDLGQKYYAPQVQPDQGSNSWRPDHDSTLHVTETPAVTTRSSVTSFFTVEPVLKSRSLVLRDYFQGLPMHFLVWLTCINSLAKNVLLCVDVTNSRHLLAKTGKLQC